MICMSHGLETPKEDAMMEHRLIVYHNYGLKADTRALSGPNVHGSCPLLVQKEFW